MEKPTATKTKFFMGLWPESAKPKTEKIGPSIISISIEDYRLNYTDIDTWWTAYLKYISTPIDVYAVDQKKDADKWYEVKKILMDQKPALYLTSTSYYPFRPHKKAVVLNKNNEAIEFNIETAPDNPYLPFFDQILSTFKFLDQAATKTTPTPALLNKTYEDKDFGYSISYSKDWIFRHTYGQDIEKLAPTDILSGIDLHQGTQDYTQASIVINLLDAHGLADIKEWITKYDLNYPKNSTKNTTTFKQLTAINYRYQNSPERQNEALYFISGTYAYRIFLDEKGGISDLTRSILESFTP